MVAFHERVSFALLLLGGRLSDVFGRRRMFLAGVIVFGAASAVCGAAVSPAMLVSSRFVQGTGEALAGPAALAMIPLLFPDSRERMVTKTVAPSGLTATARPAVVPCPPWNRDTPQRGGAGARVRS